MTILSGFVTALKVTAAYEAGHAALRYNDRVNQFRAAKARAKALGRPLVVVGDPDAGLHTRIVRAYDCGDVCVDLNGCPQCSVQHRLDITKDRLPFADGSVVIFESCVLEYVDDIDAAWAELKRVAGSPQAIFGVRVSPWCLTSRVFGGAKWVLHDTGPFTYRAVRISDSKKDGGKLYGVKS